MKNYKKITEYTISTFTKYNEDSFRTFLQKEADNIRFIKTNKRVEYANIPAAFDIETTSFYDNGEKRGIMYEWTFGVNDTVVYGRTWEEFLNMYDALCETLELSKEKRLIVYVHNLSFEFQFMRKWLSWEHVFAVNDRKPVYALTVDGVEFRCSYLLSGYGLKKIGDTLLKYPVAKMVGDLDYSLIRHSQTPMTEKELKYCENDVRVVLSFIRETIERDGDITKIPLTKTGYVRRYCRNECLYGKGGHKKNVYKFLTYRRLMNSLTLTPELYKMLKRAFQGGFTHANAFYSGKVMENVASYDFTSSYPAVMVSEKFPMSKGEKIIIKDKTTFEYNLTHYCCLFDVEFIGLESVTLFEHPLSKSRCFDVSGVTEDNGRIVEADELKTTITEQDFFILRKFYKWQKMKVGIFYRFMRSYLPTDFVKSVLKLYEDKTTLKGVVGKEEEYMRSKEMVNSCYGMCVTDICRDTMIYDGNEWKTEACDIEKTIEKDNRSKKRFLFFAWGVWVTAYARKNLFSGIYEFKNDYIYADTDSIKVLNAGSHERYINSYNDLITQKIKNALVFHGIPEEKAAPVTIKGVKKPLGVWDYEGEYSRFKTLGAKRYMTEKDGKISLTVSGVNKEFAVPYLTNKYKEPFNAFQDDLKIPADYTGKMTHTYIDEEYGGLLTDYTGITYNYYERSAVHLEPAEYSLSLSDAYIDYLIGIQDYNK